MGHEQQEGTQEQVRRKLARLGAKAQRATGPQPQTRPTATTSCWERGQPRPSRPATPSTARRRLTRATSARGTRGGRGARGKTVVFGLLRRGGRVCARIVPDATHGTLARAIEGRASRDPITCTDGLTPSATTWRTGATGTTTGWATARAGSSMGGGDPGSRINSTGSLWGYAKSGLVKHQGMPKMNCLPSLESAFPCPRNGRQFKSVCIPSLNRYNLRKRSDRERQQTWAWSRNNTISKESSVR